MGEEEYKALGKIEKIVKESLAAVRYHLLAKVSLQMLRVCPAPPAQLALLSVSGTFWTLLHLRALANAISSSEKF